MDITFQSKLVKSFTNASFAATANQTKYHIGRGLPQGMNHGGVLVFENGRLAWSRVCWRPWKSLDGKARGRKRKAPFDKLRAGSPLRFAPVGMTRLGGVLVGTMEFEVSAGQVKALQKSGQAFTLLDVREPWEYGTARLEGAKLIPMGDIPTRAHQELDPEEHIIVICHHGVRSLTVTNWLRQQGFEKVQSMRGGIDGWARTVDPKVPLY
jgi:rhodanese-related sulfurtransferase